MEPDPLCAAASLDIDEPLAGTAAASVSILIALEHSGRWNPKPLEGIELPPAVIDRLRTIEREIPGARVQFIARRQPTSDGGALLLVGLLDAEPGVLAFDLPSYEAILDLDFTRIVQDRSHERAREWDGPVFLVCTHGKRDRCCAKLGTPVFERLAKVDPTCVFRTTHVGGHRFAANIVSLPDGMTYGRVTEDEAAHLEKAHREGLMYRFDRMRGRMSLSAEAQAAEVFLRERLQERRVGALRLRKSESLSASRFRVSFDHIQDGSALPVTDRDGSLVSIVVERRALRDDRGRPRLRPASCGDAPSPAEAFFIAGDA